MVLFMKLILVAMLALTVYAVYTREWIVVAIGVLAVLASVLVLVKVVYEANLLQKVQRKKRFTEAGSNWPVKQEKKVKHW